MGAAMGPDEGRDHVRRQEVVASFGQRALSTDESQVLLDDATAAAVEYLDVECAGVFEATDEQAVLRAGTGWEGDAVGAAVDATHDESWATEALRADSVVDTVSPRSTETGLLADHGVVSGLAVSVMPGENSWGLLSVHTSERRSFGDSDAAFLQGLANAVGTAVERERTQRCLRTEHALKERIVETIPVGIVVIDADGQVEFVNERAAEILGRSSECAESLAYDDQCWGTTDTDGEPLPTAEMPFERVMEAGEPVYDTEIGIERPDGTRVWLSVNGAPIDDAAGDPAGAVFSLTDVTEQRRLETEFEEMLGRIDDAFYAVDEEFRFTHVNERAAELLQAPADALIGEKLWDAYPEAAEVDEVWDAFHTAMNEQEPTNYELYFPPLDFWVEANLYPSESGVSVYFRDVTERKEREQELEAANDRLTTSNERLEEFAYAVSHDLREPLRMVSSYLQLVDQRHSDGLDPEAEEFLEFAVDGAERMREMIDGLLEYSRVQTRGNPFEAVDLEESLSAARADLRMRVEETDAEITADDLPEVEADATQITQVFRNLLGNALQYSGDDTPKVHVSAERVGEMWRVSVADQGIGVDPEDADRIFEVFERLHTREEYAGTGIGLALCQRIVERHGGEIGVKENDEGGATFWFTLPAITEDDD